MAPRHQPPSLLSMAHQQVAKSIADICRLLHSLAQNSCVSHVFDITHNSLRPFWQNSIPACIRAQLLEQTTSLLALPASDTAGSVTGAAPLYLLVLLLADDIKKLRIELCCYYGCSHQTALLKFLATNGTGLQSLELARSTLLRLDRTLLQSVLMSASSLRYLTFKNIANDSILQIIGVHCPNLISLDVSHSKEVTDTGLKQLFLKIETSDSLSRRNKINQQSQVICKIKRNIHYIFNFLRHFCGKANNQDSTFKNLMAILNCYEQRNDLCNTLRYLNIANTGVSNYGIILAIRHVQGLESVGEYCHIGKALELLDHTTKLTPFQDGFQLKCVNTLRTTQHYLNQISKYFLHLRRLTITEPLFPPKSLFNIPRTIVCLNLQSIPSSDDWLQSIQEYLNVRGNLLQELLLRFFPGDLLPSVSFDEYLKNCPNLRMVNIDGASIEWNSRTSLPTMYLLRKIQLGKVVTSRVISQILKRTPSLRVIHAYSCDDLRLNDIFDLQSQRGKLQAQNSPIQCFYIYETRRLDRTSKENLINLLPNIQRIGNIENCALSDKEIKSIDHWIQKNNFDVEMCAGSHWFSSSCFPR